MPKLAPAYRGPAVVMGVGASFALVGSIPVAITFGIGTKTSATIIGVGFIGFGIFLILPGICWCVVVQHKSYKYWLRRRRSNKHAKMEEEKSALNNGHGTICDDEIETVDPEAKLHKKTIDIECHT